MSQTQVTDSNSTTSVAVEEEIRRAAFIEERKYLKNVTPATLRWYSCSFKAFENCITETDYKRRMIELRKRGMQPVSINTASRAVNAYLVWRQAGFSLPRLQQDTTTLATLSPEQIGKVVAPLPPSAGQNARRIQGLAVVLLDTGLRVAEALALRWRDVDLDNLLLRVMGKGRKERKVPLSLTGRAWLWKLRQKNSPTAGAGGGDSAFVFVTRTGEALSIRNAQRDLAAFCEDLGLQGVRCSPHTLRHTFAVSYLRAGGNLEYLRRILGHSSILVTQRYLASLTPGDFQSEHERFSPLATRAATGDAGGGK